MKYGFIVPVYKHGAALSAVISNLSQYNLPIIVVDDGNDETNKNLIKACADNCSLITLVTRAENGGKGKAMTDGIIKAAELGLTHILQVDSDGQHDASRIQYFIQKSQENPEALICGYPEYDATAPKARLNGRKISNWWVNTVTLTNNKEITDSLIGFRVYPVAPYKKLIDKHTYIDARMAYDTDILVKLFWAKVPVISEPVKVTYPTDGVSNFRPFQDNVRISLTYARLCLGMFVRFPSLLVRKIKRNKSNKR